PQVGAADLERAGALEVLALEQDGAARTRAQEVGPLDGGPQGHPVEDAGGLADLGRVDHGYSIVVSTPSSGNLSRPLRNWTTVFVVATSGTASSAPMIPAAIDPPATASSTARGCSETAWPSRSGWSRWLSTCCTPSTIASMMSACTGPSATSATR